MLRSSYANVVQGVGTSHTDINTVDHSVHKDDEDSAQNQLHSVVRHSPDTTHTSLYNPHIVDSNSHPLFIHNNDHPALILIAKKLIAPDNFAPWSRSMQIALNARNKFFIVNGGYAKPDPSSPLFEQWERVNDLVITWILNSVAEEISDGLNYVTTASDVWQELHERF